MTGESSYSDPLDDDPADAFDGPSYDQILASSTPRRRVLARADGTRRAWPVAVALAVALLGASVVAWGVFATGGERSATVVAGPSLTVTPAPLSPAPTPTPSSPPTRIAEPFVMRGTGTQVFDVRLPDTGLTIVRVRVDQGRFTLTEVDEYDIRKSTVDVNRGPHDSFSIHTGDDEPHRWRMEATGPWTVEVSPARSAPVRRAPYSGTGSAVFWYEGGPAIGELTSGASRPSQWLRVYQYEASGSRFPVALLTPGETERVRWDEGPYLVHVIAEAPWRITLTPI